MNDVAYRINTTNTVKKFGGVTVNNGSLSNLKATASGSVFYRDNEVTIVNESPAGTGLANKFDDPTYYTA